MAGNEAGLAFRVEWEDPGAVRAPELSATWCRLEVWVGADCVTLVEEPGTRSTRRSIYVSLYPLAEWIAYNWWRLHSDMRPTSVPVQRWTYVALREAWLDSSDWLRHHNLRGAGEGFPWPDLTLVAEGNYLRIVWQRDPWEPQDRLRYLSSGQAFPSSVGVQRRLRDLVEVTLTRLDESGVKRTRLHEEWAGIQGLDAEEEAFCEAAARLGLDPFDLDESTSAALQEVSDALSGDALKDFLSAADPSQLLESLSWVRHAFHEVDSVAPPKVTDLADLRESVHPGARARRPGTPWEFGYDQARAVRARLGLDEADRMTVEDYVSQSTASSDRRDVSGVGTARFGIRLITGRGKDAPAKRFAAARALWHALSDPAESHFLLTSARTARQKTERAFAAEVLAPAAGIAASLQGLAPLADFPDEVLEVARQYEVSPFVIQHQIENHPELGLVGM